VKETPIMKPGSRDIKVEILITGQELEKLSEARGPPQAGAVSAS